MSELPRLMGVSLQAWNCGSQFSSRQTISQTCCRTQGHWILLRHGSLCYFFPASIQHFSFKMGRRLRFSLLCVFGNPIEQARTHSGKLSTPNFDIHLFQGRWNNMAPLNAQSQWEPYYLLNIPGNVYTEHRAQQAAPSPVLTAKLWNGKCLDLLSSPTWPLLLTFSKLTYKMIPLK